MNKKNMKSKLTIAKKTLNRIDGARREFAPLKADAKGYRQYQVTCEKKSCCYRSNGAKVLGDRI